MLSLHLRCLTEALTTAWTIAFKGVPNVTISRGDIFSTKKGQVVASDPIDVRADAIVSPANSFGFMDGGIDAVYAYQFGPGLQARLQALLTESHAGELPVGSAVIVPTGRAEIPWCISAPTMRLPEGVANTLNAFLAFRAALLAVIAHNRSDASPIRTILCPGLGTGVGNMPADRCARQMRAAWDRVVGGRPFAPSSLREASRDEAQLLA